MRRWLFYGVFIVLLTLSFGAVSYILNSPYRALYEIGKAIHERDGQLFLAYVDVPRILHNQRDDIVAILLPESGQDEKRAALSQVMGVLVGAMGQQISQQVARIVEDPQRDNIPSSWMLVLASTVTRDGFQAHVLLEESGEQGRKLRFTMTSDADEVWRITSFNTEDLRRLAEEYIKI